jgi:hypothetical protein
LKDNHISYGRIKHQTKLVETELATLTCSQGRSGAPSVVPSISVGFGCSAEVDDEVAERVGWRAFLERKKFAEYFNLLILRAHMVFDL